MKKQETSLRKIKKELINIKAKEFFNSLDSKMKEKFIIDRVKRSKEFRIKTNPLQKETLFSYGDNGNYTYNVCYTIQKRTKEQGENIFVKLNALLKKSERAFKANNLHFCFYGVIHRYKKQILELKKHLDMLKANKIKNLQNIQEIFTKSQSMQEIKMKIQNLYTKLESCYTNNVTTCAW